MTAEDAQPLPPALGGVRREVSDPEAGRVSYYTAGPDAPGARPLLLIHSINAAASAHEVRPLYQHYSARRPVYAIDLPGYGFSDRSDRRYVPEIMAAAIDALATKIRAAHDDLRVDALAVSLSSEYLARAALQRPEAYRSLALVSSTGFDGRSSESGRPEDNRGRESVYRIVSAPLLGRGLFKLLTSRASVRFFLEKTWGSKEIDEEMLEYSCLTARQPGAHHAPFHFLSGFLFGANPLGLFDGLAHPTWLAHGVRGDFTDFRRADRVAHKANWRVTEFATGALPYFERTEEFVREYDAFMNAVDTEPAIDRDGLAAESQEA